MIDKIEKKVIAFLNELKDLEEEYGLYLRSDFDWETEDSQINLEDEESNLIYRGIEMELRDV